MVVERVECLLFTGKGEKLLYSNFVHIHDPGLTEKNGFGLTHCKQSNTLVNAYKENTW